MRPIFTGPQRPVFSLRFAAQVNLDGRERGKCDLGFCLRLIVWLAFSGLLLPGPLELDIETHVLTLLLLGDGLDQIADKEYRCNMLQIASSP